MRHATSCPAEATVRAEARLAKPEELRSKRPGRVSSPRAFGPFACRHLELTAVNEGAAARWLEATQGHLEVAWDFFGDRRDLAEIDVPLVSRYVQHLKTRPNGRGGTLGGGAIAQYLNSLSNLFRRAVSERVLPLGTNPVQALTTRPKIQRRKTG
jgi:hypothetical protein